MKEISKKYSNDEIEITWKPSVCIHSTKCWRGEEGLSSVFNPAERPWIKPEGASTERIMAQIDKCPSGALSYVKKNKEAESPQIQSATIIETFENGPLLVYGNIRIKDKAGNETQKNKVTALCRCGASLNKPYCDGTHTKNGFQAS